MKAALRAVVALAAVVATPTHAGEDGGSGRRASPAEKPSWEFALTAYPTVVRGGENYTSAIVVADRGPLHLEARYNYESAGARSAFVGWTFAGGEAITWELTPLLGGAWGATQAFVPGWRQAWPWGGSTYTSRRIRTRRPRADRQLHLCVERARLPAGRVAARRGCRTAHQSVRRRARHPARAVRAGDVGPRHVWRLLVQPRIAGPGIRRFNRCNVLSNACTTEH